MSFLVVVLAVLGSLLLALGVVLAFSSEARGWVLAGRRREEFPSRSWEELGLSTYRQVADTLPADVVREIAAATADAARPRNAAGEEIDPATGFRVIRHGSRCRCASCGYGTTRAGGSE